MKIRLARAEDAEQILEIYAPFIRNTAITFETVVPSVKEFAERIMKVTASLPWLVADVDGRVAGYAYAAKYREREAYQWSVESSVYVSPDFQRQGIAKKLYDELFRVLKELGYVNVYGGITQPNEKSHALHEAFGFKTFCIYEKVGFKAGAWHDVEWMIKVINAHEPNPTPPKNIQLLKYKFSL